MIVLPRCAAMLVALASASIERAQATSLAISGVGEGARIELSSASASTNLTFTAASPGISGAVRFSLENGGMVKEVLSRVEPPYSVTFSNCLAGKYFLTVSGAAEVDDLSFDIEAAAVAPVNDEPSGALVLEEGVVSVGLNAQATAVPDDPVLLANASRKTIWWKWEAEVAGPVTISGSTSDFDPVVGVFAGSQRILIGMNDDASGFTTDSQVSFSAMSGTTYFICVDGVGGSAGEVSLRLVRAAPPTISITSPLDGATIPVFASSSVTNLILGLNVGDSAAHVDYRLEAADFPARAGTTVPPYTWEESGLLPGDYSLTVVATGPDGLQSEAAASFSIVSTGPEIILADTRAFTGTGLSMLVRGFPGPALAIQNSADLRNWSTLGEWKSFSGAERLTDTNASAAQWRFYRAEIQ